MEEKSQLKSNYDALCEAWRQKSLNWDYEDRYRALNLPGYGEDILPITYYGVEYGIDRRDGRIRELAHPEKKMSFNAAMAIYHLFYYSAKQPANSGVWVPFREVKGAAAFDPAFQARELAPFAKAFDGKLPALKEAGTALGFTPIPNSDAGFEALAFDCMPLRFLFWDGDEEFPARANVLFDANITQFTHEETVVLIAEDGLMRLVEAAGLSWRS